MNFSALPAALWRNKEYGVAVAGAILIVLGMASLAQRESFPGWYAVSAGVLLIVMVAVRLTRQKRKPGDHSERDSTN